VDFNGSKTISEIDVVTQQDDYQNPVEPTLGQTMSPYGITAFDVQYWNGSSWVTVPNGSVTGNNKVWRQFTFASVTTSKIRVVVHDSADHVYSRVVELEAWTPGVHDSGGGWYYTYQSYDWKGRPLVTTNTDGTQKSASYSACGCAGNEVTTLTDEGTLVNGELKRRTQKLYADPLGRTAKTEVLNWDGSVYSTTSNTYNARDQVTLVRQYQGPDTSSVYQDTTATFDGYGRLQSKHVPEQDAGTATVYSYNPDDTVNSFTDARGASANYSYNNRHLLTEITYPPSGVTPTSNVAFGYDAAGNRTSMSDGLGNVSYSYDQLSRLTSETRYFSALVNSSTGGNYNITYQYNLASELTSITDPFSAQINYNRDTAGRVTSVTGSGFLNISSYASSIQYRAWGGQKSVSYGDGTSATTSYDSRMRPSSYLLPGLREQFQYYNDGRLQKMTDLDDRLGYADTGRNFSRVQSYDHVGRLVSASGTPSQVSSLPYDQRYAYDAFGNATSRYGAYYYQSYSSDGGTFQNNRRQDFSYDADGNVMHTPSYNNMGSVVSFRDWTYDTSGQMTQVSETLTANNSVSTYLSNHDGDGQPIIEYYQENLASKSFMIRSSVLGGKVLTRLDNVGNKSSTVFNVDGLLTAVQNVASYGSSIQWTHIDPLGLSEAGDMKPVFDPMGNSIPWQPAPSGPPPNAYPPIAASFGGLGSSFGSAQDKSCVFNGRPISCTELQHQIDIGNVAVDILLGIQHVELPVEPLGLGMFSFWVPDPGRKQDPTKDDPNNNIYRINIDKEGKGHYETFLLSVEPVEPDQPQKPAGGRPSGNASPNPIDPCNGKTADNLNYTARNGLAHITERHIDTTLASKTKSKYIMNSVALTTASSRGQALSSFQTMVKSYNASTFVSGNRSTDPHTGYIVFSYGFPPQSAPGVSAELLTGAIGSVDRRHPGQLTNVNTLILAPNCTDVITSFPGTPFWFADADPRIGGREIFVVP